MAKLFYLKRPSSLSENAPLLIMCHGYGSDENDLFSFASQLPEEFYILSLRAPLEMKPYGYAWYTINFEADKGKWTDDEQAKKSIKLIDKALDFAVNEFPVNPNNITLLGFSQGSILSYAYAFNYPQKIKNVVALSGYIHPPLMPSTIDIERMHHVEFFCSHGTNDQVIPVDWARKSKEILEKNKLKYLFNEYPVGHGVSAQNFHDFNHWLAKRMG